MSRRSQRGAVLAEFTIMSLAALTLMLGIIDFSRALYMYHLVTEDARQATRYAIVNGSTACPGGSPATDPLQAYVNGLAPIAGPGALTVTTQCSNASQCTSAAAPYNGYGCLVSVTVAYKFNFLIPIVSKLTLPMTSTSTLVI